jgi:hypothetical protein
MAGENINTSPVQIVNVPSGNQNPVHQLSDLGLSASHYNNDNVMGLNVSV